MKASVGIGIIGTGFARRVQLPALHRCTHSNIVSVASGSAANAEATAREFGVGHHTSDWRETASHPDVDLVCITTPPNLHCEMTLFALEHGKHVLCEKPMAFNIAEAEEMLAAAKRSDRLSLIDHELRFQAGRQLAWKMLRDGAIGKIRHAKSNFRAPHRSDLNIPWNWWSDAEQGGGALGAINSHIIDSLNWFLGVEISSVFCQLQTHIKHRQFDDDSREVTADDEANMILRFEDGELTSGTTGLVSVSMVEQPEYLNRVEFFGTEGAMRIDQRGEVFTAKSGETEWSRIETDLGDNIEGVPDTGFSRGFLSFAQKMIDAIRNGYPEVEHAATFADGLRVQRVLDAARSSDSTGLRVVLGKA